MAFSIQPGVGLGFMCLGASAHDVLSAIKADGDRFRAIDVHYSRDEPVTLPLIITLPLNGIRLRFDGPEQQLRLIEVIDFKKCRLTYKGSDLVRNHDEGRAGQGPQFKRIYQLFGASYPGEYVAGASKSRDGTYVLSWMGTAFTFPLRADAYAPEKDHVSLLGSSAAGPATHMAIFDGNSWPDVRNDLFVRPCSGPRLSSARANLGLPAEVEGASIHLGRGIVELQRRQFTPFSIVINETTPQDLITELGPPESIHRRSEKTASTQSNTRNRANSSARQVSNGRTPGSQPSSYSSTGTDTFDTDFESDDMVEDDAQERASREAFWCYFSHGLDILVGPPSDTPGGLAAKSAPDSEETPLSMFHHLVVTKVAIHGNIPGSYAFNRHRRLRWGILGGSIPLKTGFSSEDKFDVVKSKLIKVFRASDPTLSEHDMARGKVVNRTWGADPGDSDFFLPDSGDSGEDLGEASSGSEAWLGNTRLHNFPGIVFEVLESGAIAGLVVS
ncbi:hypothetical protein K431DRAFT_267760 [Polychaeton citri CBS 116435]|uniref:Uncharacterized protein n=1 Tax=Polychaeton citri CBS 116435 TaxID=1314669 RepID=A0A9P4QBF7_9PEZI|nr:hypothetical protein K431DRAFT_267760 [Polychaeton citri CBS 116435]